VIRLRSLTFLLFIATLGLSWSMTIAQAQRKDTKKSAEKPAAETPVTAEKNPELLSNATVAGLKLRSIGPALTSGRVVDLAVNPQDPSQYYVAAAAGGVWKTTNSGASWNPIFDNEGSYSIGSVTLDPKNPAVVWVGTGENNSQRSVGYGDGIYLSENGGKTWKNMGLKNSEHIGRVIIDPRNSNTLYVATPGPLWSAGGDRGLYKTTDRGKNWQAVLKISENTGVVDVVMDPRNPDVLLAGAYQRRRHVWTIINGGPEGAIYRSVDAGTSWEKVTNGLPKEDIGRIGFAVAPSAPETVYALVEAASNSGGIFRSTDFGVSWEKRNSYVPQSVQYYGQMTVDPVNPDRVYIMGTFTMVSDDGGRTLRRLPERAKHVDTHILWINPKNNNHLIAGSDGGVYESFDRAANWSFKANLPITQFYDVTVDNASPFYYVYGGTQDNFSLGGPSRTLSENGITNADWFVTQGGDGFQSRVDPTDPNTIYAESQYGGLARFDRRTGQSKGIRPQHSVAEGPLRWNWDAPLIISPHAPQRLYFAANKIFRSDDRGDNWRAISGDLTRQIDRNKLPVMGKIWGPDAVFKHGSTSIYGNGTALAESPRKEGLIYYGTDDGLIQVTEDGGANWRKVDSFPGIPTMTYVARLLASQHDANTVYAAFDNHKNGDFTPYLLKSTDQGRSWTSLQANLPKNGMVLAIAEDHVNPQLLFVGTEFGLYFTIDGGQKWLQLKGNLPTIAVRDLAIQQRENDLVVATFGRGIYVLDNYAPLRTLTTATLTQPAHIFPVKSALLYIPTRPLGLGGKGFQGENFYRANNPSFGATITYYLKESPKTKKQLRQEAEKAAEKNNTPITYPTFDELRAENEEPAPQLIATITDSAGNVIRRLTAPSNTGLNRVVWDLRFPDVEPADTSSSTAAVMADIAEDGSFTYAPLVLPGTYRVTLAQRVNGVLTPLPGSQEIVVASENSSAIKPADHQALVDYQQKLNNLQRLLTGTFEMANSTQQKLRAIKRAILDTPRADSRLIDDALALEKQLTAIQRELRGDVVIRNLQENTPDSIIERVTSLLDNQLFAITPPSKQQLANYQDAANMLQTQLQKLRTLIEGDLRKLENALDAADAPYTPGRLPIWKDR
jgi:photosystem II stability/assembly factor-like uncharacterized protein